MSQHAISQSTNLPLQVPIQKLRRPRIGIQPVLQLHQAVTLVLVAQVLYGHGAAAQRFHDLLRLADRHAGVVLPADTQAGVADLQPGAPATGEEAPGGAQYRRSTAHPGMPTPPSLSGMSEQQCAAQLTPDSFCRRTQT